MVAVDIEAEIEVYGTRGRATFLADYAEHQALSGRTMYLSQLADLVTELGFGRRDLNLISESTPFSSWGDANSDAEVSKFDNEDSAVVARVGKILAQRSRALGAAYPFEIHGTGAATTLVPPREFPPETMGYLALLAITLAHAFDVEVPDLAASSVEDAFEEYVAHALRTCGLPAQVVPTYGPSLEEKIPAVAHPLGLRPLVKQASFSKKAKDGGTDIVCHVPDNDRRFYPCFLLLGQATCGQTETWESKAAQASKSAWRKMLLMDYEPVPFLAVPHHVDPQHWPLLAQEASTPILDRLRLVAMADSPTKDGLKTAQFMFGLSPA